MRIFVTGGSGFIGKHVVNKLAEDRNNKIAVLSRSEKRLFPNLETITGDLSNMNEWADKVREFKPDATIHLAWEGIPDHGHAVSYKNLTYGLNLFLLLRDIKCKKVICSGSGWEYGQKLERLDEAKPAIPTDPFTAAKIAIYLMGKDVFKDTDTRFIWTRFSYVYGPGQRAASLIPSMISSIKENKVPDIRTPHSKNDFVYVTDVADALNELLLKGDSGIYNVAYGSSTSVIDIVRIVCGKIGKSLDLSYLDAKKEAEKVDFWSDISKIKAETGWEPKRNIEEGIEGYISSLNI